MNKKLLVIDAFTDVPFKGNPAGVVISLGAMDTKVMQALAAEINLSETAFVHQVAPNRFSIRWFTPTVEAPLCGHATLAASHGLWQLGLTGADASLSFESCSGPLTAAKDIDGIKLDFPSEPCFKLESTNTIIEEQFGNKIKFFGQNRIDYVVELESADDVKNYLPDFAALAALGRGLIVTAQSDQRDCDFVSRVFAPSEGIPEDPVTGSAHCCLAPYWAERLGKTVMTGRQLSNRGGSIKVIYKGDRTHLIGRAVTIFSGDLMI